MLILVPQVQRSLRFASSTNGFGLKSLVVARGLARTSEAGNFFKCCCFPDPVLLSRQLCTASSTRAASSVLSQYDVQELNKKSDLHRFVCQKIKATGPVTVEEYMRLGVTAPQPLGYYSKREAAGRIFRGGGSAQNSIGSPANDNESGESIVDSDRGDFYTTPEMTQMLGELIAVWVHYVLTVDMGLKADAAWNLVELGPGTGELMSDMSNTLTQVRRKHRNLAAPSAHLVDLSESLRAAQAKKLLALPPESHLDEQVMIDLGKPYPGADGVDFSWHDRLEDYLTVGQKQFSVFIGHEYLDALPVHKFRHVPGKGWREVLIDLDRDVIRTSDGQCDEKLRYVLSAGSTTALKAYLSDELCRKFQSRGDDLEFSPDLAVQIGQIGDHINRYGGAGLFIDYGHLGDVSGDTFRAFSNHKLVDPLENLGRCDLTADVNFAFVRHIAEQKCFTVGPVTQTEFLMKMGLPQRYDMLVQKATSYKAKKYLERCFHVLTHASEMGERFKVFVMLPKVMAPYYKVHKLAGFE